MNKLLHCFFLFFALSAFAHDDYIVMRNIQLTKESSRYILNFEVKSSSLSYIEEAKIMLSVNDMDVVYKNIVHISNQWQQQQLSFPLDIISTAEDKIFLRVQKINGIDYHQHPIEVANIMAKSLPDFKFNQYDDVGTYELYADAPWRMNIYNSGGTKQNIPIQIMCHDADLIYPLYPYIRYIDISIKKSTDASFGSILTYNGLTNAQFQALFTNKSVANATLNSKSFDQSVPTKSTTHTIEFREVAPTFFTNYYYTPVNKFLWYATFNIPATALSAFSDNDHLDVRVKFSYDGSPSTVTTYLRIYRYPYSLPTITGWYRGDTHLHSIYTQNTAEQGLPLGSTKEAAKLIGLNWIITTDHTSDFDNYGSGNINDNWNLLGNEVNTLNAADATMMYIRGQEVAVKNSVGKLVHFLGYPSYQSPTTGTFLGDGNGDATATNVTVNAALTNLYNTNGFCYAAHPFATNDELSPVVNGGIWNLGDDDFNSNGTNFPQTGGSIICNDPSVASDVLINNGNDTTKFVKDALKGGQIWNDRVSMSTTDEPEDPYNLAGGNTPFAAVPNDYSFHWNRFNQGLEIINFINKKGLLLKNTYENIQNWKFYLSAGADAHGSFNYSNTNFIESIVGNLGGSVQNNAVGKLTTMAYAPTGMGTSGTNILKAMHDGNISISDGPVLVQGLSTNGNNVDNEVSMGSDVIINKEDTANAFINLQYATTTEYGTINSVNMILGTTSGETTVNLPVTGTSKSLSLTEMINLFGTSNVPINEYFYLRQNLATTRNYGSNTPYILNSETFHALTNPIWMKVNAPPILPVEMTNLELEVIDNIKIGLYWQTASEHNNMGFEIQRSTDAQQWESIGWVEGKGNSNTLLDYSFTDNNPYIGINYYRIKQKDYDERYEYSKIVMGMIDGQEGIFIYPNPANDYIYVRTAQPIDQVVISDILGKYIAVSDYSAHKIDVSGLQKGMYFITFYNNNIRLKEHKFIKQ